jgi:hypothetical protein
MKKHWMFMLAVSAIVMFLSCKKKHNHINHHEVEHYYGVYRDEISSSSRTNLPSDSIFKYVRFGISEVKYVINAKNESYFNSDKDKDVYKVAIGEGDTIITPINATLKNNKYLSFGIVDNSKALVGRGNLGCIPKFEENGLGNVQYEQDQTNINNYIVPIYLAKHNPLPGDKIIRFLALENFKMKSLDYTTLNAHYQNNKDIEAGLDSIVGSNQRKLSIYNGSNTLQEIYEQN